MLRGSFPVRTLGGDSRPRARRGIARPLFVPAESVFQFGDQPERKCTPAPVTARTTSTRSPRDPSTTSVAPNRLARSCFEPTESMAMVRPAPDVAVLLAAASAMTATVRQTTIFAELWTVADPGGYPAAVQRNVVEQHAIAHLHDRVLAHQHVLGERRKVVELEELVAVLTEPRLTASARAV